MALVHEHVAFLYDDDAHLDGSELQTASSGRLGVMGRQVAGKEFLDAYLSHGRWAELVALVRSKPSLASITKLWNSLPKAITDIKQLRIVVHANFHSRFFPTPPSRVLHLPVPLDVRYAWVRQHRGPAAFAMSGVTHTLCTYGVAEALCQMVNTPLETYDTLFCTSKCAVAMVRAVTGNYVDYLKERHGGSPSCRVHLANVPLGVNPDKFRPATPAERIAARRALGVHDDEVMVLCVGRLSYHAKAHPFPVYHGLSQAAQATGKKVHLVFFGWAANEGIAQSFRNGAAVFATGVRVTFVDGTKPDHRFTVWQAADLCTSLSDNFQETFGLTVTEAMASGLPIVAADWDGYRDQVVDGQTGILVPTYMVKDASADATSRLLMEEMNYDQFLGDCNQTVIVDARAAGVAFARLITDENLRRRMGSEARKRVLERFTWAHVVRAYEETWDTQEVERQKHAAFLQGQKKTFASPACFPEIEISFASFPTAMLGDEVLLVVDETGPTRVDQALQMSLTNYSATRRTSDPVIIRAIMTATEQPRTFRDLDELFQKHQVNYQIARATIAWMLKYGLLRLAAPVEKPLDV